MTEQYNQAIATIVKVASPPATVDSCHYFPATYAFNSVMWLYIVFLIQLMIPVPLDRGVSGQERGSLENHRFGKRVQTVEITFCEKRWVKP